MTNTGSSFRVILNSSALIDTSDVINVGVGAMRTKVVAVLLGPSGIG